MFKPIRLEATTKDGEDRARRTIVELFKPASSCDIPTEAVLSLIHVSHFQQEHCDGKGIYRTH